jgi:diadenosine tetraphosphate (Ap4A) HIT family hydrolase
MRAAMPTLISREEALSRIVAEGAQPPCLMCATLAGRVGALYTVHEDDRFVVMLPRYVRCWGHALVVPRAHVTAFSEIDEPTWAALYRLAHRAARMVEALRQPRRVYVTSTGSATRELIQTSRHTHVHAIPVYSEDDRPADVFSWAAGVYVGEPAEWEALRAEYTRWWREAP